MHVLPPSTGVSHRISAAGSTTFNASDAAVAVVGDSRERDDKLGHELAAGPSTLWYSTFTAALSLVTSTWMVIHNKYVLDHVFPHSNSLMFVQNLASLIILLGCRRLGWIPRFHISLTTGGDLVSGVCYTVNVVAGLWSLSFLSVPIFQALKRCTIAVSWVIELLFDRQPTTMHALPAILLMVTSTLFAGHFDLGFVMWGYVLGITSCVAQGSAFELGRRIAKSPNKGICSVLVANAAVALVFQTVALLVTRELFTGLLPAMASPRVVCHLALNALSCLLLNYSIFLNCAVNSPLAHVVVGNLKTAVTTVISVLFFDARLAALGWAGICGNFCGAAWFSVIKLRKPAPPAATAKSGRGGGVVAV